MEINDTQLKDILAAAIIKQITDEQRVQLLEGAIKSLMVEKAYPGNYNDNRTKLQEAVSIAVQHFAVIVIDEHLKTNEDFKAKIKEAINVAMNNALDSLTADIGHVVKNTVTEAISKLSSRW